MTLRASLNVDCPHCGTTWFDANFNPYVCSGCGWELTIYSKEYKTEDALSQIRYEMRDLESYGVDFSAPFNVSEAGLDLFAQQFGYPPVEVWLSGEPPFFAIAESRLKNHVDHANSSCWKGMTAREAWGALASYFEGTRKKAP